MYKNFFFIVLIFNVNTSCKSYSPANKTKDDCIIFRTIVLSKNVKEIQSKAYLNTNPLNLIGVYNYWKIAERKTEEIGISFNGKVKWIFSKKDIKYIKKKYNTWSKNSWINLCEDGNNFQISKEYNTIISYPFYNKSRNKAISTLSVKGKGTLIILLEKEKGVWKIVGELIQNFSH